MRRRVTLLLRALGAALVVVLMAAPPSFAAPTLTVSASEGLEDGQTVTISGAGFDADMKGIAIGQCLKGYVGPADCNLQGGAVFRDADASGNVASFTIVVKEKFGSIDCTTQECVIAAGPLPTAIDQATVDANTYVVPITFASVAPVAAAPAPEAAAPPAAAPGTLPKTGAGDSLPVLVLGASALLAAGVGVMLLVPGRRREVSAR